MTSSTMHAVRLYSHGGPEVLRYEEVPLPQVGPSDVLVRVRATSVNSWDLRYRRGLLPKPLPGRPGWPLPFQLGRDAAGEVVSVGGAVSRWKVGDRVVQMPHPACGSCAMCERGLDNMCLNSAYPGHQVFGGYAEYVTRAENGLLALPDNIGFETAAATMWSYTTPLNCIMRRAPVRAGDTALILGASGSMAIAYAQLGKIAGATIIGTTTKLDRVDDLRAIGYDHVLGSSDPALPQQVRELTGGLGVDAAWDCVGGQEFFARAVACTRLGGSIAVLASPVDSTSSQMLNMSPTLFIAGEYNVVGVRGATRKDQRIVMDLLAKGRIKPVIDRVLPLSEAAAAHEFLESRQQVGKVVLVPWNTGSNSQ